MGFRRVQSVTDMNESHSAGDHTNVALKQSWSCRDLALHFAQTASPLGLQTLEMW